MKWAWYMVPSPRGPAARVRTRRLDVLQTTVGVLERQVDLGEGVGQVGPRDQLGELRMLRVAMAEQLVGEALQARSQRGAHRRLERQAGVERQELVSQREALLHQT